MLTHPIRLVAAAAVLLVFAVSAHAQVGTVSTTRTDLAAGVSRYEVLWLSDGSGDVNGRAVRMEPGFLLHVETVPDSGGTQPDALYDLTLDDSDAVDVLDALAANLSQTTAKIFQMSTPLFIDDDLVPVITNAGNAKRGTIVIWMRDR